LRVAKIRDSTLQQALLSEVEECSTMAEHRAFVHWASRGGDFSKGHYSREHTWRFDGGVTVPASSSPSVVPLPYSNAANVDPEEAFVAAIASCHLLTFLDLARRAGFEVENYEDEAVGVLEKNEAGKRWVSSLVLRPKITYRGEPPSPERTRELHTEAHHHCFIANSVKTEIRVAEPEL
jgi:organic hydroperoxide reductase OsmC/OhrA